MSTSRKVKAKLARQRRSARKATSTEATQKEPEPEPTERSTDETQAATQRVTVTASSVLTGTKFVCFCHWLSGQKLFAGLVQDSVCPSGTQRQTTPGTSQGRQPAPQKRSLGAAMAGR